MGHVVKQISSFEAFMKYLTEECTNDEDTVLFRGQREDKPLLARLARITPRKGAGVLEIESEMFQQFRRESRPYLPAGPWSDWDLLVIAQHHGLPTRLLDWSKNPLAALCFAVENPPVANPVESENWQPGVVWVFRPPKTLYIDPRTTEDPFKLNKSGVVRPYHIAARIVAQIGWFTAHAYYRTGFRAMEQTTADQYLTKLEIPASAFCQIRSDLDRCGVNRASLFPDLDGLCRHIEWLQTWLSDEPSGPGSSKKRQAAK